MKKFLQAFIVFVLFIPSVFGEVVYGNPAGAVTITEYFDYQCPHCRTLTPVVERVAASNSDVKVVTKVIPIMSPESWYVARAAIASKNQGGNKFQHFNSLLVAQRGFITASLTMELAEKAGLNISQLKKDMAGNKVSSELRANVAASREHGISQIPVLLIAKSSNPSKSKRIVGDASASTIQEAVDSVR